ncbi:MAG: malonate decarboxylase subunit alpha [Firmicutes bacterium]|nr:malonate decarboxylase subunit alpha [Bacillota bacterium]
MENRASRRTDWTRRQEEFQKRLRQAQQFVSEPGSKVVNPNECVSLLEAVIRPGDRVALEGNNQKQADFLAECLCRVDVDRVNDLHMVQSVIALPSHCEIFERGIARLADFSYSAPQSTRVARMVEEGKMKIGEIHTYLELFGRYFVDLTPDVALITAIYADGAGNLYTGPNTEDTPTIVEATKFRQGIVVAQVERVIDKLPRVDIPAEWVDFLVPVGRPCYTEPLFTRDPALITDVHVLMAMMVIKGIYKEYEVKSLNHGIGFGTCAIELLLPTFGESLGLKGKVCSHWAVNPHPSLIPAIETGFVESIHSFGSEVGMEDYMASRPDVFFIGPDGSMRSNRAMCQVAGHYAIDAFVGSTLQVDKYGNSSAAVAGRIAGFGGAPNMGCDPPGRRHSSPSWLKAGKESVVTSSLIGPVPRGRKLVIQMVETFGAGLVQSFVHRLDAWTLMEEAGFAIPPIMVYGDAVTHLVTEEGIAHLLKCTSLEERESAIKAVAGYTELGREADPKKTLELRRKGIVQTPEDLGIDVGEANTSLLAARSIRDLVEWSGGLYRPPDRFREW